jgi:hypothetical protein
VPDARQHEADKVPVLELLRQYTLREYIAVLAVALIGGAGLVFMLSAAGTGSAGGETLALKRETTRSAPAGSVRSVEVEAFAAARRAKERARMLAERRRIHAMRAERAARRAAVAARARSRSAARRRTVVRSTPRPVAAAPIRVVNPTPSPAPRPKPAPVSTPAPKKSGSGGGGGGFDDSG